VGEWGRGRKSEEERGRGGTAKTSGRVGEGGRGRKSEEEKRRRGASSKAGPD